MLVPLIATSLCYANDGHPKDLVRMASCKQLMSVLNDSVPDVKKIPDTKAGVDSNGSVIKEVPKSKKQVAPIAVPASVKVKPIKVVKPKIITPVIKIK